MKIISWLPLLVLSLSAHGQGEERSAPGRPAVALFETLDKNGDGKLSEDEIDLAVASLRILDRDKDGTLSESELRLAQGGGEQPAREGRPADQSPPWDEFDQNGDGKVSREEAPERMKERFDRIDRNGDGSIDKEEQKRANRLFREMRERGGRFPGEDGRPGGEGGRPFGPGAGAGRSREDVWKALAEKYDQDKNGTISAAEYTRSKAGFSALDRNEDGQLSMDDFRGQDRGQGNRGDRRGAGEAPQKGEKAPDFELGYAIKGDEAEKKESVKLSSFNGERPVALIFGSYT